MSDNYAKWLEGEKNRIDEVEKKYKKDVIRYSLIGVLVCVVVFGAIGLLAGGGIDIEGMLRNVLIMLCIGIVFILFMILLTKSSLPGKRYMRGLKNQIEDVLSAEEKEEFALQMLGAKEEVKTISWIAEDKTKGQVRLTRDYALQTTERGTAVLVQLQKVKSVVEDVKEYTITARGGGVKMQTTTTYYPMYFYYQKLADGEKKKCDKEFNLESRQAREQLSYYLHEMKIGK